MDDLDPPETLQALQARLQAGFHPPSGGGLDAIIGLEVGQQALVLRLRDGALEFRADAPAPDVTFHFADLETAWTLLSGRADPFEAFMDGRFRSDGYLLWTFTIMTMFRAPTAAAGTNGTS